MKVMDVLRLTMVYLFLSILAKPVWHVIDEAYGFMVVTFIVQFPIAYIAILIIEKDKKDRECKQ